MEKDGNLLVDRAGLEFAGGGLDTTVRDTARFGEMLRNWGSLGGQPVVPRAVVEDIRRGASREDFAKAGYPAWHGWSYRKWWITPDRHGAFLAFTHTSIPACEAVADLLMR